VAHCEKEKKKEYKLQAENFIKADTFPRFLVILLGKVEIRVLLSYSIS